MEGLDGIARRTATMQALRNDPPREIGGCAVAYIGDYEAETIVYLADGRRESTGLPKSDVLYYGLENGVSLWFVRPVRSRKSRFIILPGAPDADALSEKLLRLCGRNKPTCKIKQRRRFLPPGISFASKRNAGQRIKTKS